MEPPGQPATLRAPEPEPQPALPPGLRVLYTGGDGHLYLAEGDGTRTTRLTWANEDFSTIPGFPGLPGVLGELEDGYVFAHPCPSPDGVRVAVFGLLPTVDDDLEFGDDDEHESGESWADVDDALDELSDSLWDETNDGGVREDDVAGPGVVFALVTEGGERILGGDLESLVDLDGEDEGRGEPDEGGDDEDDEDDQDDEEEESEFDGVEVPMFWPGGKLYVVHRDGVQVWEVWDTDEGSPTHLEWSPDGCSLLVLHQQDDRLHLYLVDAEANGVALHLASGLPLFWDWQPGGALLAVRVTDSETEASTLQLIDTAAQRATQDLGPVGNFYSPAWRPDGGALVFARSGPREDRIVLADPEGNELAELMTYPGRAAFRWDAAGKSLAVAVAPNGEGPFSVLELLDPATGAAHTLFEGRFVAFRWLPGDGGLLLCQIEEEDDRMRWCVVPLEGAVTTIGVPFMPSREAAVGLHFFEQLGLSHPFLSADGRHVVISGEPLGEVIVAGPGSDPTPGVMENDEDDAIAILVAPLDGGPTVLVGHGQFACFGVGAPAS